MKNKAVKRIILIAVIAVLAVLIYMTVIICRVTFFGAGHAAYFKAGDKQYLFANNEDTFIEYIDNRCTVVNVMGAKRMYKTDDGKEFTVLITPIPGEMVWNVILQGAEISDIE